LGRTIKYLSESHYPKVIAHRSPMQLMIFM